MKIWKSKKLLLSILIVTILTCVMNIIIIVKQCEQYQTTINTVIANIVGIVNEQYSEVNEAEIIAILNASQSFIDTGTDILTKYGIHLQDISAIKQLENQQNNLIFINLIGIFVFLVFIMIIISIYSKNREKKLQEIINYIEAINQKNYNLKIEENSEDELSNLTNELYKITIMLKEQAESSIKDKKVLQTSIEDISHQLKTPLTSISIMLDNIRENPNMEVAIRQKFIHEISRQIEWINWLIISLLKLSKLDSNTVTFVKKEIDVRKLLDNVIQNLAIPLDIKQQQIIISGDNAKIIGDYNWQLEAIINIVKNCIEVVKNFVSLLCEVGTTEKEPEVNGRNISVVISPKK